jgi:hypothetical protein
MPAFIGNLKHLPLFPFRKNVDLKMMRKGIKGVSE